MVLPANAKAVANNSVDFLCMSTPQILGLKAFEVRDRLRTVLMIEIMPRPVAERAAVNERRLQSKMQAHLRREVDSALADLRFIRFAGTGVSLTGHHAELASCSWPMSNRSSYRL